MSRIEANIDALVALGASPGQVEHWMLDLGLRDSDEPTDIEIERPERIGSRVFIHYCDSRELFVIATPEDHLMPSPDDCVQG